MDRYFESGPSVCHWNMARLRYHWSTPYWRHTLSEWVTSVVGVGFTIRALLEPRPTPEQVAENPHLDDCHRMPFFLIFDLMKPTSSRDEGPA